MTEPVAWLCEWRPAGESAWVESQDIPVLLDRAAALEWPLLAAFGIERRITPLYRSPPDAERLRAENEWLRGLLRWALTVIEEWADGAPDDNGEYGTPAHDCEFVTNPEKGACDFHDWYWDAVAALDAESTGRDDEPTND